MRISRRGVWIIAVAMGILLAAPSVVRAQPRISPVAASPIAWKQSGRGVRGQWDVYEFSRYVGVGGVIGATGGLVYGLAVERGKLRPLAIVGDSAIGFTVGIVGGAAVYLVKSAFSRR